MFRLHRVVHIDRAGLVEQFVHRSAARPGDGLVGRDDHPLDPRQIVQRLQRDDHLDRRAVRVGNDAALGGFEDRLRVYFRHDQRHVRLHPETGGVVDHYGAGLGRARREHRRHLGAGRGQNDIDTAEIIGVEALDLEDIVLAEGNLLADRARRGQCHDIVGGKIALGEGGQDLASDIAGRADHGYFKTHIETPRRREE